MDTTEFDGKNWAVPFNSNAGFIFYRTDEVDSAPKDWETLYKEAGKGNGVVYQGFRYEGLTVNFLELLYSAGGTSSPRTARRRPPTRRRSRTP